MKEYEKQAQIVKRSSQKVGRRIHTLFWADTSFFLNYYCWREILTSMLREVCICSEHKGCCIARTGSRAGVRFLVMQILVVPLTGERYYIYWSVCAKDVACNFCAIKAYLSFLLLLGGFYDGVFIITQILRESSNLITLFNWFWTLCCPVAFLMGQ